MRSPNHIPCLYIRLANNFPLFFGGEFIVFLNNGRYLFFSLFKLISVYFLTVKMECQVKKNEHCPHLLP